MEQVVVSADDDGVNPTGGRLQCYSAEDIVGFVAVELEDGDTQGFLYSAAGRQLI